jgi:hypothetical protein
VCAEQRYGPAGNNRLGKRAAAELRGNLAGAGRTAARKINAADQASCCTITRLCWARAFEI